MVYAETLDAASRYEDAIEAYKKLSQQRPTDITFGMNLLNYKDWLGTFLEYTKLVLNIFMVLVNLVEH